MNRKNIVREKSYSFAILCVKTFQKIEKEKREFVLSRQLLRSGTSIGANIEEAQGAISKRDFIAKIHISYKEALETKYWLSLLMDTHFISEEHGKKLIFKCEELIKLLGSILKSAKRNE